MTVIRHTGHVLDVLADIPDASVDLVATSPPFLALRNYNDLDGQWGSEPHPAAFLDNLLTLATELRRVLTPHGSIAIELGDTYSGSGGAGGDYTDGGLRDGQAVFSGSAAKRRANGADENDRPARVGRGDGWPLAKSLCLVPSLFAASLAYGRNLLHPAHEFDPWRIRNLIGWARNNPPVGALGDKVRPATSYITVATVAPDRWFDLDAVRGPGSPNTHARVPKGVRRQPKQGKATEDGRGGNWATLDEIDDTGNGAPPLDHWHDEYDGDLTWLINTQGSNLAHYAMWPARLAERLILSMCPAEVCRDCGQPRRRITERTPEYAAARAAIGDFNQRRPTGSGSVSGSRSVLVKAAGRDITSAENVTVGWSDCGHGDYRSGVVLDPFAGTGTTLAVADIHGRDAIGIDLDPANHDLYARRYAEVWRQLGKDGVSPVTEHGEQLDLLAAGDAQ